MSTRPSAARRRTALLCLVACGPLAATAIFLIERDRHASSAQVEGLLEEPSTFCGTFAWDDFSTRVATVEDAVARNRAPHATTVLTVGFIRRAAALPDTPSALRPQIRRLAATIERADRGPFDQARRQADALDAAARRRCH